MRVLRDSELAPLWHTGQGPIPLMWDQMKGLCQTSQRRERWALTDGAWYFLIQTSLASSCLELGPHHQLSADVEETCVVSPTVRPGWWALEGCTQAPLSLSLLGFEVRNLGTAISVFYSHT